MDFDIFTTSESIDIDIVPFVSDKSYILNALSKFYFAYHKCQDMVQIGIVVWKEDIFQVYDCYAIL